MFVSSGHGCSTWGSAMADLPRCRRLSPSGAPCDPRRMSMCACASGALGSRPHHRPAGPGRSAAPLQALTRRRVAAGGLASEPAGRRPPQCGWVALPLRWVGIGARAEAAYHRPAGFSGAECRCVPWPSRIARADSVAGAMTTGVAAGPVLYSPKKTATDRGLRLVGCASAERTAQVLDPWGARDGRRCVGMRSHEWRRCWPCLAQKCCSTRAALLADPKSFAADQRASPRRAARRAGGCGRAN